MALSLKINLVTINLTKTMRFNADLSISEVCKDIREKTNAGGGDHGLFQAVPKPRWLRPEKTLKYYDIQSGMELEYKKKHRQLKIKLLDDTVKTVLVDDSSDVAEITEVIGKRMNIKNPEEFSLKVLTSNSWLNPALTLTEQGMKEDDVLLLKKKFFFNDANVDRSDPVQLHLLYVQSCDAIVSGDHPTTRAEALDLAALQLQVTNGDYLPTKHNKPGWFALKDVCPPQHQKSKNMDKDIIKEYQKLINTNEINAKFKYIQLCRSLKTYGITFFEVKVKIKKKLTNQLLGVTRHAVMQMEPETKEVIKEFPLTHLKRWAPSATSISLDFGDYEDDYLTLATSEGDAISQLISGYIDIILKTRKDAARVIEDDEGESVEEEHLLPVRGVSVNTTTTNTFGGTWDPSSGQVGMPGVGGNIAGRDMQGGMQGSLLNAFDLGSALSACTALIDQIMNPAMAIAGAESVALAQAMMALGTAAGEVSACAPEGGVPLDNAAVGLAQHLKNLIAAAKKSAAENGDDVSLLDGAKAISEAVRKILTAAALVAKDPNDPKAIEALRAAQLALRGAEAFLQAAAAGTLADQATQNLLNESAKMVAAAIAAMLAETDPLLKGMKDSRAQLDAFNKCKSAAGAASRVCATVSMVSPAILDPANQQTLQQKCHELEKILQALLPAIAAGGFSDEQLENLNAAAKRAMEAIAALVTSSSLVGQRGHEPQDLITPTQTISKEVAKLSSEAKSSPSIIAPSTAAITEACQALLKATKIVAEQDPTLRDTLLGEAKALFAALAKLTDSSKKAQNNPSDSYTMQQLTSNSANLEEAAKAILKTARTAVIESVKYWAKNAAAATTGLVATSIASSNSADANTRQNLIENSSSAAAKIPVVLNSIQRCNDDPDDPNAQQALLAASKSFAHPSATLVATAKRAVPKVGDMTKKTALHSAADDVAQALKNLMFAVQVAADEGPSKEVTEALEQLNFISADLDAAAFAAASGSLPRIMGSPDSAIEMLAAAIANLRSTVPPLEEAAHKNPGAVGQPAKVTSSAVYQTVNAAKTLASYAADNESQKKIIQTCRGLVGAGQAMIDSAVDLSHAPNDKTLEGSFEEKKAELERLLNKLLQVSPQPGYKEIQEAMSRLEGLLNTLNQSEDNRGTSLQQLNDACKSLGIATSNTLQASRIDPKQMAPHTLSAAEAVDDIVDATKTAAANGSGEKTAPVPGLEGPIAKILAELKDLPTSADKVEGAKHIAKLTSEVIAASKRACTTSLKDKPQARRNLILATEKLANSTGALARAAKNGNISPLVVQNMHDAIRSLNNASGAGGGANADGLVNATRACAEATLKLVTAASELCSNPKDSSLQSKLSSAAKGIPTCINGVQSAALQLLPGIRECEESGLYIGKLIADLDAFGLFAAAGQVDPEEIAPGKNYEDCQNGIHSSGQDIKNASNNFQEALQGSQEDLASAAREIAKGAAELANYSKATGALGADKNAQSELIEACIKCESECQALLSKGKEAYGNMGDRKWANEIGSLVSSVESSIDEMNAAAEKAAAESARGIMEIDKATRYIQECITAYKQPGYQGNTDADATSLVKSARVVAASTGDLVVGAQNSQEELVAAAMKAASGVKSLLEEGKGGGNTSDDPKVRARVDEAVLRSATSVNKLLGAAKAGSKSQTIASQVAISTAARECADQLQEVVSAANQLPGGEGLTLEEESGTDLDELAESELRACAQAIENAAKSLLTNQEGYKGDLALEGIHEAIMIAATAIAQATGLLVKAAHGAQKERVANLGNPKTKHLYRRDPTWANGLISAAQKVASTTQFLVNSANGTVQGKSEEEELIASAKQVSSSTAHLVSASRAKSDPNSAASKQLSAAAKSVAEATQKLVDAVKENRNAKPQVGAYELDAGTRAEMEQQIEILKLEKALEMARQKLTKERSNAYQKGK